jgi:hypothetical protein
VAPEESGVVGVVSDAGGSAVTVGTVYFVPAADVAGLGATIVAVDSNTDEPLEDTIRLNGAGYAKADVDAGGVYRLPALPAGKYFVAWMPPEGHAAHLPGGSACRVAQDSAALVGTRLDLTVSSATPADAEYVGSGKCVTCHGRAHISGTMHRLGIWSDSEAGPLQNLEARFDDLYQAVTGKFDVGQTVYFAGYDSTRGFDKYRTTESDPGADVSFTVTVQRNPSTQKLEMLFHNVKNAADPDRVYTVDAIYGGGVNKQRYLTRLPGTTYTVLLPLQFQNQGAEDALRGRTSKVWRDYNGFKWYDEATATLKAPAAKDSFEKNCVSCHAVGSRVTGSDATSWTVETVKDALNGDFDYDGDGIREEMNVGCESCHGPGSKHWEAAGQGKHIVSLSLLTPEREAMVCGQCHSRPKGALNTDSPVNAQGRMMVAGTSRNEFLKSYATSQLDGAATDYYADGDSHSKSHHQQYSDFIRSGLYKNGTELITCATCHDPHRKTADRRQLRSNPDDNASCGACHESQRADLPGHINTAFGARGAAGVGGMHDAMNVKCIDCHMPKTAKTGAGTPGMLIGGTQYWQNDVTSHLFVVPLKANSSKATGGLDMSTPYTKSCGLCHTSVPAP